MAQVVLLEGHPYAIIMGLPAKESSVVPEAEGFTLAQDNEWRRSS